MFRDFFKLEIMKCNRNVYSVVNYFIFLIHTQIIFRMQRNTKLKLKKIIILINLLAIFYYYQQNSISNNYVKTVDKEKKNGNNKWIVVTSTKEPSSQILKLAGFLDFQLLVLCDYKPNESWFHNNTIFLDLNQRNSLAYRTLNRIPINSLSIKNIGYLFAIENGAKYIYDTVDDNLEINNISGYFISEEYDHGLMLSCSPSQKLINPYAHFGQPLTWPRGYPLEYIRKKHYNNYISGKRKTSTIQQGMNKFFKNIYNFNITF